MRRALTLVSAVALAVVPSASAAFFLRLTTTAVHRGGLLRGVGNAHGMRVYALPLRNAPMCMRYNTCAGPMRAATPPAAPFTLIGRVPPGPADYRPRAFAIRVPRALPPGRYKVFVWCKPCGGTLLVSGRNLDGQTLSVVP